MAFGNPPMEVVVEVRQGLWQPPRWFGCEPKPMLVLVLIELFAFMMHTRTAIIAGTLLVVVWGIILREQFKRDPYGFEIRRRNVWYLALRRMRGVALVSSKVEPMRAARR